MFLTVIILSQTAVLKYEYSYCYQVICAKTLLVLHHPRVHPIPPSAELHIISSNMPKSLSTSNAHHILFLIRGSPPTGVSAERLDSNMLCLERKKDKWISSLSSKMALLDTICQQRKILQQHNLPIKPK